MPTRIQLKTGHIVTCGEDGWQSDPPEIGEVIDHLDRVYNSIPRGGYDPDPLGSLALWLSEKLGGRVIEHTPPDFDPNVEY
jgi:hypothetical protein